MSTQEIASVAVAAVLAFWILGAYNRLVRLRQTIASAYVQVEEVFRERHELLGRLIHSADSLLADTPEAVEAVDAARRQTRVAAEHALKRPLSVGRMASLVLTEQVLQTAVKRLLRLLNARPAPRGDADLRALLKELSSMQHRLSAARSGFNKTVLAYNRGAQQFPTRLVAAMFGFRVGGTL